MAESSIKFRMIRQDQHEEVLDFLKETFFTDEPMNKCLDFQAHKDDEILTTWERLHLKENLSLIATDAKTDEILGICINGITNKKSLDVPLVEQCSGFEGSIFIPIIDILYELNHKCPEVYDELEASDLFDIKVIAINQQRREKGLGKDLLRRSIDIARTLGLTACKTEATGVYSRKAFERLGFEVKAEVDYATYKQRGADNAIFASIEPPHTSICFMTKKI